MLHVFISTLVHVSSSIFFSQCMFFFCSCFSSLSFCLPCSCFVLFYFCLPLFLHCLFFFSRCFCVASFPFLCLASVSLCFCVFWRVCCSVSNLISIRFFIFHFVCLPVCACAVRLGGVPTGMPPPSQPDETKKHNEDRCPDGDDDRTHGRVPQRAQVLKKSERSGNGKANQDTLSPRHPMDSEVRESIGQQVANNNEVRRASCGLQKHSRIRASLCPPPRRPFAGVRCSAFDVAVVSAVLPLRVVSLRF